MYLPIAVNDSPIVNLTFETAIFTEQRNMWHMQEYGDRL